MACSENTSFRSFHSSSHSSDVDFENNSSDHFASYQVSVLDHSGPGVIFVRKSKDEEAAHRIDEEMEKYFEELYLSAGPTLSTLHPAALSPGCLVALRLPLPSCSWHRARLLTSTPSPTLLLLDRGRTVTPKPANLFKLPDFLSDLTAAPPTAVRCHLFGVEPGQAVERREEMEMLLHIGETITMRRRGPAWSVHGEVSLPVDLVLSRVESHDPFAPREVVEESLTGLLRIAQFEDEESELLDKTVEESLDDDDVVEESLEFGHVQPMTPSPRFRWPDPELPSEPSFLARGTYVDDAGQIYLQLHSHRRTIRTIKKILNEKLRDSRPDCAKENFKEQQEVCVRWKDGDWYRGRFLGYQSSRDGDSETYDKAVVLLVDYGNMYLATVTTDLRSTIYAERVPVQVLQAVLHNIVPAGQPDRETWGENFLDYLNDEINYAQPGHNALLKVRLVGQGDSFPLPVTVETESECGECQRGFCKHISMDLGSLVSSLELQGLGVLKAGRRAALYHQRLIQERKAFQFFHPLAPGSYPETNVDLLLVSLTPASHLLPPEHFLPRLPSLDLKEVGLAPGGLLQVMRIAEVTEWNEVMIQPWGEEGSLLWEKVQAYLRLVEPHKHCRPDCPQQHQHIDHALCANQLQEQCSDALVSAPVLAPRPGVGGVVWSSQWGEQWQWCRVVVEECGEGGTLVRYVDWGSVERLEDSQQVRNIGHIGHVCWQLREMPREWETLTAVAVKVELDLEGLEEDRDVLLALMMECLLSRSDESCWVSKQTV